LPQLRRVPVQETKSWGKPQPTSAFDDGGKSSMQVGVRKLTPTFLQRCTWHRDQKDRNPSSTPEKGQD
jgi:hypothetical protein